MNDGVWYQQGRRSGKSSFGAPAVVLALLRAAELLDALHAAVAAESVIRVFQSTHHH
jgi:hypothetical protein